MAKAKATKTVEVTSEEKRRIDLAYEFFAGALPLCVIIPPIDRTPNKVKKIPGTENVKLDDFELLYKNIKRPLPNIVDPTTSESIGIKEARKKFAYTEATLLIERQLTPKGESARSKSLEVTWIREYTKWYDEALNWLDARKDEQVPGRIRVAIDEILEPAIRILDKYITKIGNSNPIFLTELDSVRAVHRQLKERLIPEWDRFVWTMDVLHEVKKRLPAEKTEPEIEEQRRGDDGRFSIVKLPDGGYEAEMAKTKERIPFKGSKTFIVITDIIFSEWKVAQDRAELTRCTQTTFASEREAEQFGRHSHIDIRQAGTSIDFDTFTNSFSNVDEATVKSYLRRFNAIWRKISKSEWDVLVKAPSASYLLNVDLVVIPKKSFGTYDPQTRRKE